jgi:hypothetical protein
MHATVRMVFDYDPDIKNQQQKTDCQMAQQSEGKGIKNA